MRRAARSFLGGFGKENNRMDRRKFTKLMGVAVAGMVAGSKLSAQQKADDKAPKHICKGQNACKGQGGCKTGDNGCAGKNSCKGKGGCGVPVKEKKDTKNP